MRRALDAGADAIVFESELESTLAVAVRAVASGQSVVPRKLRASVERPAFSHRERQVLSFVSRGLTNAQIADKLFLSESTIKSHLSSAFSKFGVRSRKEAAALFLELEQTERRAPTGPRIGLRRARHERGNHVSTATQSSTALPPAATEGAASPSSASTPPTRS